MYVCRTYRVPCAALQVCCRSKLNRAQKTNLVNKVRMDYRIHMIMDNLPASTVQAPP